jgi:hypothetical protein
VNHNALKSCIRNFEENPATQVKFHWFMMMFWIVNAIVGTIIAILFTGTWVAIGVLYVFLLSIYANWDTDYGAVSAAQASLHSEYLVTEQKRTKQSVELSVEKLPDENEQGN